MAEVTDRDWANALDIVMPVRYELTSTDERHGLGRRVIAVEASVDEAMRHVSTFGKPWERDGEDYVIVGYYAKGYGLESFEYRIRTIE